MERNMKELMDRLMDSERDDQRNYRKFLCIAKSICVVSKLIDAMSELHESDQTLSALLDGSSPQNLSDQNLWIIMAKCLIGSYLADEDPCALSDKNIDIMKEATKRIQEIIQATRNTELKASEEARGSKN